MGLDPKLCTHFMYGFGKVSPNGANGDYKLESFDPNADHPSGHTAQDRLCPKACNDPNFVPDWSDPDGLRCDWPCNPSRQLRGYEGLNVGMKKKNPAIKTFISVGGWNFNDCAASPFETYGQGSATCHIFSDIASSEANIRKFATNVITFCRQWGFDGFDLDWEYPVVAGHNTVEKINGQFKATPQDHVNYINMLRILKEEFIKESSNSPLLLTAAVGVGKSTADTAYDIPEMSKHLDLINLMTYDLHGAWEQRTGCNANLYATEEDTKLAGFPLSVSWAIDYWLSHGAPASKLTMGLATYGRGWMLRDLANTGYNAPASGPAVKGISTKEAGYRAYYEIQELLASGATATYDEERQCPFVVSNGEWFGYDNEQSFCAKLAFAKSRGLAGSMIWALDLDDFDGMYHGGVNYPLIGLASQGGSTCSGSSSTTRTRSSTAAPTTSRTLTPTTIRTTTVPDATSTTMVSTTSVATDGVQSGDTIFLKTRSGNGNHIDVQGSAVRARWESRGNWQAMKILKKHGGSVHSGDLIYLRAHTGSQIDVTGEAVQARFDDQGTWQALVIEKRTGSGAIMPEDVVCLKAHTGKLLDVDDALVRARWSDCGDRQAMRIEKESSGALFSGDGIHLAAHTGMRIDVDGQAVQARFSEAGEWQKLVIENLGGRAIFSGDIVFLKAHTGVFVDVEGVAVQARWNDRGGWQRLVIEKKHGSGAVMAGDTIFLRSHTGSFIDVQGERVQARWSERGDWQALVIQKSAFRRLFQTTDDASVSGERLILL